MKKCHVCGAEYNDDIEMCADCGAELHVYDEQAEEKEESVIEINNPVLAASVDDVVTAEIYRDILTENGIPFSCEQDISDGSIKVVFGGGFVADDIYVDESNLELAKELYEQVCNTEFELTDDFGDEAGEEN